MPYINVCGTLKQTVSFPSSIVTEDETCVHYNEPEMTMSKKLPSLLSETEVRSFAHRHERLSWLIWKLRCVILEHYLSSVPRTDLFRNHLPPAIRSKWRGLVCKGAILQTWQCLTYCHRQAMAVTKDVKCPACTITVQMNNVTSYWQFKYDRPTIDMHQRVAAFCYPFLIIGGVKSIDIHRGIEA